MQQGRLQRSSLFLVHALQRRLLLLQPRIRTEAFDDELKYVLTELGSPFKGLGRTVRWVTRVARTLGVTQVRLGRLPSLVLCARLIRPLEPFSHVSPV